jgi:hypothetical protein
MQELTSTPTKPAFLFKENAQNNKCTHCATPLGARPHCSATSMKPCTCLATLVSWQGARARTTATAPAASYAVPPCVMQQHVATNSHLEVAVLNAAVCCWVRAAAAIQFGQCYVAHESHPCLQTPPFFNKGYMYTPQHLQHTYYTLALCSVKFGSLAALQ